MLKQILVKDFNNFMDQPVSQLNSVVYILEIASTHLILKPFPEFLPKGPKPLLLTSGETWKTNRQILTPTFSTSKMKMVATPKFTAWHAYNYNCLNYQVISVLCIHSYNIP